MNKLVVSAFLLLALTTNAQTYFDLKVIDAGPFNYVTPGTYPVYITAKNLDINYPVSTLMAHWQMDEGTMHTCTINQFMIFEMIYPGFLERFTHADSMTLSSVGTYTVKVWTSMPAGHPDTNPSNDTASLTIHVVDNLPEKKIMMFYGTHTECFPCGAYGEPQLDQVLDLFPETVYLLSAHDGYFDPYMNDDGIHLNDVYMWPYTGHPAFVFDLFTYPYFYNVIPDNNYVYGDIWKAVPLRADYRYPVEVKVENLSMDTLTHVISGEVHAKLYADYSGALSVNAIISEDSIYDYQAGISGNIYHRHILRDMTEGLYGKTGIIPGTVSAGEEFTYFFSETLSADINEKYIYVTGVVQHSSEDSMKCDMLNAGRQRLTDFSSATSAEEMVHKNGNAEIFPNPAKHFITIKLNTTESSEAVAEICSTDGRRIIPATLIKLHNGSGQLSLEGLNAGFYFVKLTWGENHEILKLIKE